MPPTPETWYAPIIEPTDPASVPPRLGRKHPTLAPLRPGRGGVAGRRLLNALAGQTRLTGHFCYGDHTLRRLERRDPLGLRLARAAHVEALVTMDTPYYAFMTAAQRERAWTQHHHRILASLERLPQIGVQPIPLVIGQGPTPWIPQLDLLQEVGAQQAALYARELLLEGRAHDVARFVRAAHRRRLRPLLIGAFTPQALRWGPATLAARRPYVLARRGRMLGRHGAHTPLQAPEYSTLVHRWLHPRDVASLAWHNHARAQRLLTPCPGLATFGTGA